MQMARKQFRALVIPAKPISEIRKIAEKFGMGKINDIRTVYHPYVHFNFTYDEKRGLLRRATVQKEGESVLDSDWGSYPIKDFDDFFRRRLSDLCSKAVETDILLESIPRSEDMDPKMLVKKAFEAIIEYVAGREEELVSKSQQVDERTQPLMREADRLSGRGHLPPRSRTGLVSRARAAETIIHHVREMKGRAKKEQEKFRKEILKKMKKSLGVANIKEILQARLVYYPHHMVEFETGKTEILDHNGRRIRKS